IGGLPAAVTEAVRCHDRGGYGDLQDGGQDTYIVRTDARAEVRDLDGFLLQLRRAILATRLPCRQRCGQDHSGRCLCAGLSTETRGTDRCFFGIAENNRKRTYPPSKVF